MGLQLIDASGTPADIGRAHGAAGRAAIELGLGRWRSSLSVFTSDGDVDAYLDAFLRSTDFLAAIEEHTPWLLDEVWGIADGAGIGRDTMLAYQFMDEQWCYEHRKDLRRAEAHHCSSIAIARAGGGSIIAQNMDLPVHFDGTQTLVRAQPDDAPDVFGFTAAGLLVTTGMNAAGVGVCVNSIMDRPTAGEGLPVAFVIRGALACSTAAAAADFVRSVPHATGQNYVIADATDRFDLEAAADGVLDWEPEDGPILHTNHSLAFDEGLPTLEAYADRHRMDLSGLRNSHERRRVLVDALGGRTDGTEDEVTTVLADRGAPVCRLRDGDAGWMTFGSVVMSLREDGSRLTVWPGPSVVTEPVTVEA